MKSKQLVILSICFILTALALASVIILFKHYKIRPVEGGRVTSGYGYRTIAVNGVDHSGFHNGLDISAPAGTPIKSILAGVVDYAGFDNTNGNKIKIQHKDWATFYGHMLELPTLKAGDRVKKGQVIGKVGSTGLSTGPHVHFIVYDKTGKHTDPMKTNIFKI